MKSFLQFITEVRGTAAEKAKRAGLVYSSDKGAYVKKEKPDVVVARAEKGDLHYVSRGGGKIEDGPKRTAIKKSIVTPKKQSIKIEPQVQTKSTEPDDKSSDSKSMMTIVFGRFNPPTTGHEVLLNKAKQLSVGDNFRIYPSRTQDPKKNPLDPGTKITYMRKIFPKYEDNIVNDNNMKTIFDVLKNLDDYYSDIVIVVGSDRKAEFSNLADKYNGKLYNYDSIEVISAGERAENASGVKGQSASKMRDAVKRGDKEEFMKGIPNSVDKITVTDLYKAVKNGMNIKDDKKVSETWEIAPRYDERTLRENYRSGLIYKVGDMIESLTTGLIGEIIRRGTNYLICVTEDNIMFKPWIKDVMEAVKNYPGESGTKSDNRLIATDKYREYTMRMTGTSGIKNFINKYKKKSK